MTTLRTVSLFAAASLALLVAATGCSGADDPAPTSTDSSKTEPTGSGSESGSGSRKSGSSRSSSGGGSSSGGSSSSSSESYGFCLDNAGWSCPSASAKSACVKGSCGPCTKDPSQCSSASDDSDSDSE